MTNDLMTTFLELCDPRRDSLAVSASDISWENISDLSKRHGVTPFLFYRTRQLGIPVPEDIKREWLGYYLYQLAEEQKARRQIKELKEILDPAGVPFVLLKGGSAMLRLYPEPGLRTFADLDILIPVDKVDQFKRAIVDGGYRSLSARNSPEDEELRKFDNHLDPLQREECLMIEPHLSILMGRGEYSTVLPEIWRDREKTKADGILVDHLSKEHCIIHSILHCARDLSDEGFIEIKGLIDVLYAVKKWKFDWLKLKNIAEKWGVEKQILPVMATLNQYWQTNIPLPVTSEPIALNILVSGIKDREKEYYANLPASYGERLSQVRRLPNVSSQFRYALRLFFPTRENLRWRYGLSSKWSVVPYYFLHLFFTLKKFLTGLCHQILFHPK